MRWAVLGTGAVSRKFVLGLRALGRKASIGYVASRSGDHAKDFAATFRIDRSTSSYMKAASAADIDAVYVATPPSEHEAHALAAIDAGKAVLIEKPFAMDVGASKRIAAAARAADVFCMEAMWTRFHPLIRKIKTRLDAGEIGTLLSFYGSFYGADKPDPSASLFDPARGGGALMHRGIYPLSLARYFLGPIAAVTSSARIGGTGVDEDCAVILTHTSGAISTIRTSLTSTGPNEGLIQGAAGTIKIREPIFRPFIAEITPSHMRNANSSVIRMESVREGALAQNLQQRAHGLVRVVRQRRARKLTAYYEGNGYHYEAAELMKAVSEGRIESATMPLDQSIEIMATIDSAKAAWTKRLGE